MKTILKKLGRFARLTMAMVASFFVIVLLVYLAENGSDFRNRYRRRNHTCELTYGCREVVRCGKIKLKDQKGHTIIRGVSEICYGDSMAVVVKNHKRGYVNLRNGKLTVAPQYNHAWLCSEGLCGVVKDEKVGFIDTAGNVVIDFRYPYYDSGIYEYIFRYGYCTVADPATKKVGVIDHAGNWVISPEYDEITVGEDGAIVLKMGGWKQLLAYDGTLLQDYLIDGSEPLAYELTTRNPQTGEYVKSTCMLGDLQKYEVRYRTGLMNGKGEFLTPPVYSDIQAISDNLLRAKTSFYGPWILLDRTGRKIR